MTLPERADYSLTESALSPFPAEPAHNKPRGRLKLRPVELATFRELKNAHQYLARPHFPE